MSAIVDSLFHLGACKFSLSSAWETDMGMDPRCPLKDFPQTRMKVYNFGPVHSSSSCK